MLWLKAFHIVAVVAWFAGLFYLPRLFVYHAATDDAPGQARFCVMERKLFNAIMTPSAIVTTVLGLWLLFFTPMSVFLRAPWMHVKLALVVLLWAYHVWCGVTVRTFARGDNQRSHRYFRVMNELPTLILVAVVILVVVKPF